ncbi:MAG: class I adenylate cyclase [Aestuariibacter sp.]
MNLQQNLTIRLLRVLRYNKARTDRALELLPTKQRPLFHTLPFLLHINHPRFPGYIDSDATPFGICNYTFKPELKTALIKLFPENEELIEELKPIWPRRRLIESVMLMGSIGSIGQSVKSDFDYWVCIDEEKFAPESFELLNEKFLAIEQWADDYFGMEVHFFQSEINRVYNNDFGEAGGESSGSAQGSLLKAEFYTTNIMVAGKAPFWWLVPDSSNDAQYKKLYEALQKGDNPDPSWFMDLGNLERINIRELFGAAIWQISKAMDSPFKSLLKMAKLEVFMESVGSHQPLCNILKKKVHNGAKAPTDLECVDPYSLMFEQLVEFYQERGNDDVVELLRICLYIKSECALSRPFKEEDNHFKRQIIKNYVQTWGWSKEKIKHLDGIKHWEFLEVAKLGKQIHSFLISCYRRMSRNLEKNSQLVSAEDSTVIGRKIDSFYTKKEDKIVYQRRAFEEGLYLKAISIKAELEFNMPGKKRWTAYRGKLIDWNDKKLKSLFLRMNSDAVDLILWCVFNRIIDSRTKIYLSYICEPLKEPDVKELIKHALELFPPIKISEIPRAELLMPSRILRCLIVLNFETRRHNPEPETIRTIYLTSWGELYSVEGFDALQSLRMDLFIEDEELRPEVYVYAPQGSNKKRLYEEFMERTTMEFENLL